MTGDRRMEMQEIAALPTEKQEYIVVKDHNLSKFIKDHYGFRDWEFAIDQESGNDVCYEFVVDGVMQDWEREKLQKWCETGEHSLYGAGIFLNHLAMHGHIEKGNYLVRVNW